MPKISVVAPVYNEMQDTLQAFVERVTASVTGTQSECEIVLVDDGSRSETWDIICTISRSQPHVKGLRLARNFGQHPAIAAGLDHTTGDWVVVMDSDLQDRPEVISALYEKATEGFDVVFVNRQSRPESALYRLFAGIFYRLLNLLSGTYYDRHQGNYSIISKDVVEAFRRVPDRDRFYGGTVRWLGFQKASITAQHGQRQFGKTTYNLRKRFQFAFRLIFGFSTRLLYVSIIAGLTMGLLSFVAAVVIIINKIRHPELPVPGWPSVMTAVFFTAGVTNITLGFIGIYTGRLFEQTKNRPIYIIAQATSPAHAIAPKSGATSTRNHNVKSVV